MDRWKQYLRLFVAAALQSSAVLLHSLLRQPRERNTADTADAFPQKFSFFEPA
jgi:hypothetical protein